MTQTANVTIVNEAVPSAQTDALSNTVGKVAAYYRDYMGRPIADQPIFLRMVTLNQNQRDREGSEWAFATWPTIAMSGSVGGIGTELLTSGEKRDGNLAFIAHEMGHYYFGTYKVLNSELGDMMSEGFTEYISLKLVEDIQGKDIYDKKIEENIKYLTDFKTIPIAKIKSISEIGDRQTFVYDYAPMMFIAIEKEIGTKKMWEWMHTLLTVKTDFTNYNFLLSTLRQTLRDEKKLQTIIDRYFANEKSVENIINVIKKRTL